MREGVWMANYNLITSKWFGALLTDTDQGWVKTPTYHLWDLYRNYFGNIIVPVDVESPSFNSPALGVVAAMKGAPYLDAVASKDSHNNLYLSVINRHMSQPVLATITAEGVHAGAAARVTVLSGPSENSINGRGLTKTTASGPLENVRIETTTWKTAEAPYAFPPHSITVLKWILQ
jgi:alpha-N-arabinofuranosidase